MGYSIKGNKNNNNINININNNNNSSSSRSNREKFEEFWRPIWESASEVPIEADWIKDTESALKQHKWTHNNN